MQALAPERDRPLEHLACASADLARPRRVGSVLVQAVQEGRSAVHELGRLREGRTRLIHLGRRFPAGRTHWPPWIYRAVAPGLVAPPRVRRGARSGFRPEAAAIQRKAFESITATLGPGAFGLVPRACGARAGEGIALPQLGLPHRGRCPVRHGAVRDEQLRASVDRSGGMHI